MRQQKLPLVIHIDDWGLLVLNKECRFCPTCELVIVHQDDLEELLAKAFSEASADVVGNSYLVVGTLDRSDWRKSLKQQFTTADTIAALHDFLQHLKFEQPAWVWIGPAPRSSSTAPK